MKNITVPLQTLLDSGMFVMADLFIITLVDSTILRYTSADVDLEWDSDTYTSSGLLIKRSQCSWKNDLSVDTMNLEIYPQSEVLINGQPFLSAVRAGEFDGADVEVYRAFLPVGSIDITGIVNIFMGRIAEITANRTKAEITVNSPIELLNINIPRNIYQPSCGWNLYDSGCTLHQADFTLPGSVNASPTDLNIVPVSIATTAGYYDNGVILFTSGALDGKQFTIQSYDGVYVYLPEPLPVLPSYGDTFELSAGCDKQQSTCASSKFNNLSNFRGFPYVPNVEAVAL